MQNFLKSHSLIALATLVAGLLGANAQERAGTTPKIAAVDTSKPVSFKAPSAELKASDTALEPGGAPIAGSTDLETLIDRRESLETEVRYTQNKLDTDRKRVLVHQSLNEAEEADRLTVAIRDAESRIRNSRAQLAQVEDEIGRLQNNTASTSQFAGEEVILPGENLEVIVNEDGAFNGRYVVRRGGYIIMPGIGRVSVAGKSLGSKPL